MILRSLLIVATPYASATWRRCICHVYIYPWYVYTTCIHWCSSPRLGYLTCIHIMGICIHDMYTHHGYMYTSMYTCWAYISWVHVYMTCTRPRLHVYIHIYICIYIYTHTHIHINMFNIYMYIFVCVSTRLSSLLYINIYIHMCTYIYVCIYIYTHIYIHICKYISIYVYVIYIYIIYVHMCVCLHTHRAVNSIGKRIKRLSYISHIHIYTYTYIHTYIHTYIYIYRYI